MAFKSQAFKAPQLGRRRVSVNPGKTLGDVSQSGINPATGEYLSAGQRKALFKKRTVSAEKVFSKPGAIVPVSKPGALVKTSDSDASSEQQPSLSQRVTALEKSIISIQDTIKRLSEFLVNDAKKEQQNLLAAGRENDRLKEKDSAAKKESGLESVTERMRNTLLSPIKSIGNQAKGILSRIMDFFKILFVGWLTDKGVKAMAAFLSGDSEELEKIKNNVLVALGVVGGVFLALSGGLALLPSLILPIAGLIGKLGIAIIGFLMSPAGLATLAVAAGVGGLIMAGKGIFNYFRERGAFGIKGTGGEAFTEAHNEAKKELEAVGVTVVGTDDDNLKFKIIDSGTGSRQDKNKDAEKNGTKEQKEAIARYKKRRSELNRLRDEMDKEVAAQRATIKNSGTRTVNAQQRRKGISSTFATKEDTAQRDKLEQEVRAKYAAKLSGGGGASVQPQTPLTPGGGGGGSKEVTEGSGESSSMGDDVKVVKADHPETGSGYTIEGVTDAQGRPVILSKSGAEAFAKMIKDSNGAVKGSDVASSQRSPAKNKAVGGVPNSRHMNGTALDIHGTSNAWIRKNGQKYGWVPNDYSGSHGGHFIFGGGGPGNVQSSISASSIQSMPSQSTGTPGQMPKAQPNVVFRPNTQAQQSTPPSSGSGGGSKKPNISSSNPNNFYTMYSQIQYNVVR